MPGKTWVQNVQHTMDGEEVKAAVDSRAARALEQQTGYLKERLSAVERGQGVVIVDQTVAANVLVGMPVFFNNDTQQFEPALAAVEIDPTTSTLVNSPSSDVVGIVAYKQSSTSAMILLSGKGCIDLSAVVQGPVNPGRYYLSSRTPGGLVLRRPSLAIPILLATGSDNVVIAQIQNNDLVEDHAHYRIQLYTNPAGTVHPPYSTDERHVITNPDPSIPGWLPADNTIFQGLAPLNAVFGYNLDQHPELSRLWPPIPEEAASITLFREDLFGYGQELPSGLVVVDRNGLWWMSNCYGDVPWPTSLNNSMSLSSSGNQTSESETPPCPRPLLRALILSFAKVQYADDKSVVTSIRPTDPTGPIQVTNCDGKPASTGDLGITFNGAFLTNSTTQAGSIVFKSITSDGKFNAGPVVEGVVAGNSSVSVTGTITNIVNGVDVQQGIVTIVANLESAVRIITPQLIRLNDAKERYYQQDMYLALPPARPSDLRLKFRLPGADGFPINPVLQLRLVIIGRSAGTLPELTASYRRIPRPLDGDAVQLPVADTTLAIETTGAVEVDQYMEFTSDPFTVVADDVVLFSVLRSATDGYVGEIGILDAVVVLAEGS